MKNDTPLVSVIVPVYNAEKYLGAAIESILLQHHESLEILVVDDGSTDNSAAVADAYPAVRCLRRTHGGTSDARNAGLENARGAWIAFQDADDLWLEGKLRRQWEALAQDAGTDAVLTKVKNFLEPGFAKPPWLEKGSFEEGFWSIQTLLARREVFDRVGPFDRNLPAGDDTDWLMRARDKGVRMLMLDEVTVLRRIHDTNITHDHGKTKKALFECVRRSLSRKREKA